MTWRQVGTARRPRPTCKSSNPSQAGARGAPAYLSGLRECLSAGPLFKNPMTNQDYFTAAELYLGSNRQHANAHGPRSFRSAAAALRFAIEEAAPVSLHGARLHVGRRAFTPEAMLALYNSDSYPLTRKNAVISS